MAIPNGALTCGFRKQIFLVTPSTSDISYDNTPAKLFSGKWYTTVPDASHYSMTSSTLTLTLGGSLATENRSSLAGTLPYLIGSDGFYVEFAVQLSTNDADHWPAVWVMPQEHDNVQSDHLEGDPTGYEKWMELDVDEGGGAGLSGNVINWSGISGSYASVNNQAPTTSLDRTVEHIFGAAFQPKQNRVSWWVDGVNNGYVDISSFPNIIKNYHYYLNIDAQSHGSNTPYSMLVRYFAAYSIDNSANNPGCCK
jgi:hypothetical protein